MVLLDQLRRAGEAAEPWALALHEKLHERLATLRRDGRRLARPTGAGGAPDRLGTTRACRTLLEQRLEQLPSEELEDLVPRDDADLTAGDGGQLSRIRVFELLAEARRTGAGRDVRAHAELARLEPLVRLRLRALVDAAEGRLARSGRGALGARAGRARAADARRGARGAVTLPPPSCLRDVLPHPVAREGSALLEGSRACSLRCQHPTIACCSSTSSPSARRDSPTPPGAGPGGAGARRRRGSGLRLARQEGHRPSSVRRSAALRSGGRPSPGRGPALCHEPARALPSPSPPRWPTCATVTRASPRTRSGRVCSSSSKQGLDFLLDVLPLFRATASPSAPISCCSAFRRAPCVA